MKKALLFGALIAVLAIAGCSNEKKENGHAGHGSGEMIDVKVVVKPDKPHPGNESGLEATVTQGGKPVEDADEVKFEIRKSGSDESEEVEAEHDSKGLYTAQWVFPEEGKFFVTAHVTARSMHNMPTIEVEVKE